MSVDVDISIVHIMPTIGGVRVICWVSLGPSGITVNVRVPKCPILHYVAKLSMVPNCVRCQIVRGAKLSTFGLRCQIVRGAKLSTKCHQFHVLNISRMDGWMDHFAGLICLVLIIHKGCVDMTSLI